MLRSFLRITLIGLLVGTALFAEPIEKDKKDLKLSITAALVSGGAAATAAYLGDRSYFDMGLMAVAQGALVFGYQHYSQDYSLWISRPYSWDRSLKSGLLSNIVKRAWVGALVIGGINLVSTYPGSGLEAHAPYTWAGFWDVLHGAAQMTLLSTPVNMALSMFGKRIRNAGGQPGKTIEKASLLVSAVQNAAMAANAGQQPTLGGAITAGLAAVGGGFWAKEAVQNAADCHALEKLSKTH